MSGRYNSLGYKPSLTSLNNNPGTSMASPSGATAGATGGGRPFRPCANCTCSPGLLSRQGRRSSLFVRQLMDKRKEQLAKGLGSRSNGSGESVYSSDTICQARNVNTTERLKELRKKMKEHDLGVYIVPSEDEHQSEYVSAADQRRSFISGFTGSAGVACISRDLLNFNDEDSEGKSILSTDGRYFNQALQELDYNWSLVRQGEDSLTWQEWCVNEASEMSLSLGGRVVKIGIDPKLISYREVTGYEKLIRKKTSETTKSNVQFVAVTENLVDAIWGQFEPLPVRACNDLIHLNLSFSGESFADKRKRVLSRLSCTIPSCDTFCVVALDEICWLLNLRGSDIAYNPVFYAYLLLRENETQLFTNNPFDVSIKKYFSESNITVRPYEEIWSELESTASEMAQKSKKIAIPSGSPWQIVRVLQNSSYQEIQSPVELFKAVKNETEIKNARAAQVKDGVCLAQYFAWLEEQLTVKDSLIDEYRAACKLLEIRKTQPNFRGNSFETISSTGANAAVIHYSPPVENSSMIDPSKIYLCDSGSQFLEGTTDITRTLHFTKPSKEEVDNYTLVLKGNLALERLVFPSGTSGYNIDVIARQFLWERGLDYRHGTGHGIGSFLNVHEGPIGIGFRPHLVNFPLEAGNIISNEPGFYKDGEYGLRIENDMLISQDEGLRFGEHSFLKFENITMVPYCRKLINVKMLTPEEKNQINHYHRRVWESVVHFLQPQSIAFKWLKRETAAL
ncbi:LAMI_0C01552g1_1 [Lachancea mirantina]|uniref:Xaa-Pro aminopeptidase n=1 Tax=Lachancea mirantina TaxID=1230905 RepID=A0A1G4J0E9_9SACH|nr:LAMI_0C01552g1_1 [Lachancea mirantina]